MTLRAILIAGFISLVTARPALIKRPFANSTSDHPSSQYLRGRITSPVMSPHHRPAIEAPPTNLTLVPNCTPAKAACAADDQDYVCSGTYCWCNWTTEGEGICFNSMLQCHEYTPCKASSDCLSTQRCFDVGSCNCPDLPKVCSDITAAVNGSCAF